MERAFQRITLIAGLLLYIVDYGSDMYVAFQYHRNNETWWFSLTLIFIIGPSILVNIRAIFQDFNVITSIAAFLQLTVVLRYIEAFYDRSRVVMVAKLRYLETMTESAPQWCLQVYIMIRQWYFPWYTVLSSALSLVSLAWSVTALEKERVAAKDRELNWETVLAFLIWQIFTLISRVSAIVIIAYVYRYYAIIFLVLHWLIFMAVMLLAIKTIQDNGLGSALFLSCLTGYTSLFHFSKTDVLVTRSANTELCAGYFFLLIENAILLTLSFTYEIPETAHMDILKPVVTCCVVIGSFVSLIGFIFYYCCADRGL